MSPESQTVLVIDDDAAVRSALKFVLEVEGFRVQLYRDSDALLGDGRLPKRGCIVIDYWMPGIDGIDLVDMLRARGVALPAILISGRVNQQLRGRAERSGVTEVLEKPLADAAFIESIRRALARPDELPRNDTPRAAWPT